MMTPDELLKLMVQHERELREQSAEALARALDLHSREIDLKLDKMRENHERLQRDLVDWKLARTTEIAEDRQRHHTNQKIMTTLLVIIGLILAIGELILRGVQ